MRVLTLCGSLRARSSNRAMLLAYERVFARGEFIHYEGLGGLPHFNPDLDCESGPVPPEVEELRQVVTQADALVVSTPEYVHALPGSFKNALDWLVSDPAFVGKPVVILHAARGSDWALASLREVLKTMSARIVEEASVGLPLNSNALDADAILASDDLQGLLVRSAKALEQTLEGIGRVQ